MDNEKLIEAALVLKGYCKEYWEHNCEGCIYHDSNTHTGHCLIGCPKSWELCNEAET